LQSAPLSKGPSQSEPKRDKASTSAEASQIPESTQSDLARSGMEEVHQHLESACLETICEMADELLWCAGLVHFPLPTYLPCYLILSPYVTSP
jgi:hypothetical protein